MSNQEMINKIAGNIVQYLSEEGFTIHRYNAYTSNSVYIKLDYGVCNSIRISDHSGKQHLQYRYNLIIDGEVNIVEERYMRYYYNQDNVRNLIAQILFDKRCKLEKYGAAAYKNFMSKNANDHKDQKGFWVQAKLVAGKDLSKGGSYGRF